MASPRVLVNPTARQPDPEVELDKALCEWRQKGHSWQEISELTNEKFGMSLETYQLQYRHFLAINAKKAIEEVRYSWLCWDFRLK